MTFNKWWTEVMNEKEPPNLQTVVNIERRIKNLEAKLDYERDGYVEAVLARNRYFAANKAWKAWEAVENKILKRNSKGRG
jgi:hypothetical protein